MSALMTRCKFWLLLFAIEGRQPSDARARRGQGLSTPAHWSISELCCFGRIAGVTRRRWCAEDWEIAHHAGASAVVRLAQEEIAAMGSRPRKLALTGPAALTGSERRVARMAADGMTNNGIAQTLFVTVNAMKLHLTNAYRELGITSRVQLSAALEDPHGDELLHKDSVL